MRLLHVSFDMQLLLAALSLTENPGVCVSAAACDPVHQFTEVNHFNLMHILPCISFCVFVSVLDLILLQAWFGCVLGYLCVCGCVYSARPVH